MGGMFTAAAAIDIDEATIRQLATLVRSGNTPQRVAQKCRVILLAHRGVAHSSIALGSWALSRTDGHSSAAPTFEEGGRGRPTSETDPNGRGVS